MDDIINIESKIALIKLHLSKNKKYKKLDEYFDDILYYLANVQVENIKNLNLINNLNYTISELNLLLVRIKEVENKRFHDVLKNNEINLDFLSDKLH